MNPKHPNLHHQTSKSYQSGSIVSFQCDTNYHGVITNKFKWRPHNHNLYTEQNTDRLKHYSLSKSFINFYKNIHLDMIPTGFVKYLSYSSSVYLITSTACTTACKLTFNHTNIDQNQIQKQSSAKHLPYYTWQKNSPS